MRLVASEKRVFGLDLLRATAIMLVVLGHGRFILNGSALEGFPHFRMIDGVDMFFVLSGFLIGGILLKEINKEEKFSFKSLLHFWKRRWFRTLPNYYLILFLNYLFVRYSIIKGDITEFNYSFLIFTQNFKSPFKGFFWESWSLSIEEWFYILSPLLLLLFLQFLKAKWSFLLVALCMIIWAISFRASIHDDTINRFIWDITFRKTVLSRLDSIGYGVLAAWIFYYFPELWKKIKWPSFIAGIALMVYILNRKALPSSFYLQVYYLSLIPISVLLIMPMAESIKNVSVKGSYFIEHISKISYSMYLINLALVAQVIENNFNPVSGTDAIFKYGIYWLVVIIGSTLLYKYFEKPIMDLRERI